MPALSPRYRHLSPPSPRAGRASPTAPQRRRRRRPGSLWSAGGERQAAASPSHSPAPGSPPPAAEGHLCAAVPCRYKATEPHRQRQRRVSRPGSRRRAAVTLGGGGGGGGDSPGGGAAGQERRCPRRAAAATRPRCGCGCGGGGAGEPGCGCTSAQPSVSSRCRRAGGCGLPIAGCRPPHARRQRRKVPRRAAPPCRQPGNAAGGRPGRAGPGGARALLPPLPAGCWRAGTAPEPGSVLAEVSPFASF